ncbi:MULTISPECIES: PTS sugar transporter subunit IIC [unclassified Collinsella]|jgi:PTS system cellobiose-specific IIC component|uniref:PTS sugar transporter subunit IIC n=1 Tax=unclassified Collinsella TaxID=2637548 RepID=UPI000E4C1178|nr:MULTISPECIES: PTS transporter subunit EIIC [unclassified Collinsella]RHJ37781.1 PTS sugar transporter subunit IIC [Collinsella sp. AM10-48]RHJ37924.1 PTS sugar transporter subunit IIC [Collinsella sp. AM10-32]RHJ43562.1 PTS sugar transporter subunit IIC [Collinsella sp. AM10-26]RHJ44774.1 PTS sugar transporter subunit IIC [Collinsella sp. AM10-27]RHJ54667.1 PTS sugar transporter subunit IIC [Collinsella sp. AM10-11]
MLQKFMEAIQAWITEHVVPVMNKLTSTYWFGVISDAVLYIVPFSMVSAIPSLWNIIRRFVPALPDLSPLTTFSFGLVGMFMAFIIPHNVAVKEDRKDRSMIAGFTGIGAFMLCMNPTITDQGYVFQMAKFGAGGMFTAMVVGFVVGFIYKRMARMTFFSEDSLVPDFVKNWFDNIIAVLLSLFVAWLFTNMLQVDVFSAVAIILSPVTGFAQTLPGTIAIPLVMDTFYFFGISGWVFSPIQQSIQKSALAENMAAYAAGLAPTNINAYGITRYIMIGGEGATLPLAFYMLFAKSKKNKTLGRATIIPSLFNINEPLVFSTIVANPFMFIPMVLQSILLSANAYLWMSMGWASLHVENFDMNFLPNAVSAFFMSGGDVRNIALVCVNLLIAAILWFPFFKAADDYQCKIEEEQAAERAAKKAAKKAAKEAAKAAAVAAAE